MALMHVVVPGRTRAITNWHVNRHVTAAYTKEIRNRTAMMLRQTRHLQTWFDMARETLRVNEGVAMVRLTRFGGQVMDGDNLQASCKAVRDEVAAQFRVDDRDGGKISFAYHQQKWLKPGQYETRIDFAVKLLVPIRVTV